MHKLAAIAICARAAPNLKGITKPNVCACFGRNSLFELYHVLQSASAWFSRGHTLQQAFSWYISWLLQVKRLKVTYANNDFFTFSLWSYVKKVVFRPVAIVHQMKQIIPYRLCFYQRWKKTHLFSFTILLFQIMNIIWVLLGVNSMY